MCFPNLKRVVRIKCRVFIIKPYNQSQCNFIVVEAVHKSTAEFIAERITHGVIHFTRSNISFGNAPQFFHAEGVDLFVFTFCQVKFLNEFLCQTAACAFGENRQFGFDAVSGLEVFQLVAMMIHTGIDSFSANHFSVIIQNFTDSKSRIYLHAFLFGFFSQITANLTQRSGVIAFVAHVGRMKRNMYLSVFAQHHHGVFCDFCIEGNFGKIHVRQQRPEYICFNHSARQDMTSHGSAFLNQ